LVAVWWGWWTPWGSDTQLQFNDDWDFGWTNATYDSVSWVMVIPALISATFAMSPEIDNGNSWSAKTITWLNGNNQLITMNDDCTFTFNDVPWVTARVQLKIIQDWFGWHDIARPANVIFPNWNFDFFDGMPDQVCIVTLYWDWTYYYAIPTNYFYMP
jgi:hypothetical protein